jgi:hypothetical protein
MKRLKIFADDVHPYQENILKVYDQTQAGEWTIEGEVDVKSESKNEREAATV